MTTTEAQLVTRPRGGRTVVTIAATGVELTPTHLDLLAEADRGQVAVPLELSRAVALGQLRAGTLLAGNRITNLGREALAAATARPALLPVTNNGLILVVLGDTGDALSDLHLTILAKAIELGDRFTDVGGSTQLAQLRTHGLMNGNAITDLGYEALRMAGWLK